MSEDDDDCIECDDDGSITDEALRELEIKLNAMPGAVAFAREAWHNDGAEGETVHLLAKFAEQIPLLIKRMKKAEKRLDLAEIIGVQGAEDWDEVCVRCNSGADEPHDRADCLEQDLSVANYVTGALEDMLSAAHVRERLICEKINAADADLADLREFVREPAEDNSKVGHRADHIMDAVTILRHSLDDSLRIESWRERDKAMEAKP